MRVRAPESVVALCPPVIDAAERPAITGARLHARRVHDPVRRSAAKVPCWQGETASCRTIGVGGLGTSNSGRTRKREALHAARTMRGLPPAIWESTHRGGHESG